MKIILLEKFRKLGEVGDVVKVKDGYARNFLIPNRKALPATKSNIEFFEIKKDELKKQSEQKVSAAQKIAKNIDAIFVTLVKQAGDDGRLYGSVTSSEIAALTSQKSGEEVSRKQVTVNSPIKYVGIYRIDIELGGGVYSYVNLNVARTEGEADEAMTKFKNGQLGYGAIDSKGNRQIIEEEIVAPKPAKKAKVEEASEEAPATEEAA